jgi:diguanylate cyclase (GGDEF)-like protein
VAVAIPQAATAGASGLLGRILRPWIGPRGVWLLSAVLASAAFALTWRTRHLGPVEGGLHVPLWALFVAFAVADMFVVHLTFGRQSVSFSISEIPIALTFGALSPATALVTRVLASALGLSLGRHRVRGIKLAFNLASAALETVAAILVYRVVLDGADPFSTRGWASLLAASLAVDVVSGATIFTAMSLLDGRFDRGAGPEIVFSGIVAATVNACLAVITLIVLDADPVAGLALGVVAVIVLVVYRAWTVQSRRFAQVQSLFDFTRSLEHETDAEGVVARTLREAMSISNAAVAEIVLFGTGLHDGRRYRLDAEFELVTADVDGEGDGWWTVFDADVATRWPTGRKDQRGVAQLACVGRKEAMVAPLRSARNHHGALLVADRADEVSSFTDDDLRLVETLASTVAVELDNARLVRRLRDEAADKDHQALHDSLTGLPNRRCFTAKINEALAAGHPVSVLLMDLDRFKEVNDTLGHAAGDQVLAAVAERLQVVLGDRGLISRFGGDEFAVLLPLDTPDEVLTVADALLDALQRPVQLDHVAVDLGASIGAALAPMHGSEPDLLVQHADVAMYLAKDHQTGVELYAPDRDSNDVRRLGLLVELRKAIHDGDLDVAYQIKSDLRTDEVMGVEALVRWTSPTFGVVGPDEFVPLAECTGLIAPLTDLVIARALAACAQWRAHGWRGGVAVNLSARSLLDQDLPASIARHLADAGLPAEALTLEITESSIMREPDRTIVLLRRLRALGVRLSVDDFGTGYSSLSYLKRLPVQEVKIDRAFVAAIERDAGDMAIVRAIIHLAHDLDLAVVAEGVETDEGLAMLRQLGADVAQGYLLGRPLGAAATAERLGSTTTHGATAAA